MSEDQHQDLPWLINQSEENESLKEAISQDKSLQEETDFLSSLRDNIQSQKVPTPGEFGLARLKREIEETKKGNICHVTMKSPGDKSPIVCTVWSGQVEGNYHLVYEQNIGRYMMCDIQFEIRALADSYIL